MENLKSEKIKLYALRHVDTGKLVGYIANGVKDDTNFHYSFDLSYPEEMPKKLWVASSYEMANQAAFSNPLDTSYETPNNSYVGSLEVVEMIVDI